MATGDRHLRIARFPSRAAIGLAALLVCAATADAATARFAGVVWDAVGHGLSGVAVVLYPSDGGAPVLATSGESGEFEFQLAGMNRRLAPEIETVFMTPAEKDMFISASLVKEIAFLGRDVSEFVDRRVAAALTTKMR